MTEKKEEFDILKIVAKYTSYFAITAGIVSAIFVFGQKNADDNLTKENARLNKQQLDDVATLKYYRDQIQNLQNTNTQLNKDISALNVQLYQANNNAIVASQQASNCGYIRQKINEAQEDFNRLSGYNNLDAVQKREQAKINLEAFQKNLANCR